MATPLSAPRFSHPWHTMSRQPLNPARNTAFADEAHTLENCPADGYVSSRQVFFPRANVIPVSLSEPRDVLQSERTFLGFIRFALSLFFVAVGLSLGFKLQSNTEALPPKASARFGRVTSILLVVLALVTLIVAGLNYFGTVRRYSQKRINTESTHKTIMTFCISAVVVTLAALNVSLIVESYLQE